MRATGIIKWCSDCGKEFEVFADDGAGDNTTNWNWCPHCGVRQELWMRFKIPGVKDDTPLGISCEEAAKFGRGA